MGALSTDIIREIKSVQDITYTNNLKLGNVTVSPNIGNILTTAYLGSIPLTKSSSSKNSLIMDIDDYVLPVNDNTGTHVFIDGKSVVTGSNVAGTFIGTSYQYSTSATHNIILLHGSVRGAWFYTTNGNIPIYERKTNNLSLNINESSDNKKLYIGFSTVTSDDETFTYVGHLGNNQLKGSSDEFIIYENDNDVKSHRDKMSFTLKLFHSKSIPLSGGGGSSTGNSDGHLRMFSGTNLNVTFYFTSQDDGTEISFQSTTKNYDYFPDKTSGLQLYYLGDYTTKYKLTKIRIASFTIYNGYSSSTVTYKWSLKVGSPPSSISEASNGIGGFSFTPNGQYGYYTVPEQVIYITNSPIIYRSSDVYIY